MFSTGFYLTFSFIKGLLLLIFILLSDIDYSEVYFGLTTSTALYSRVLLYGCNGLYDNPELKKIVSFSVEIAYFLDG